MLFTESVFLGSDGELSFIKESEDAKLQNEDVLFSIADLGDFKIILFEYELLLMFSGSIFTPVEPCLVNLPK